MLRNMSGKLAENKSCCVPFSMPSTLNLAGSGLIYIYIHTLGSDGSQMFAVCLCRCAVRLLCRQRRCILLTCSGLFLRAGEGAREGVDCYLLMW